MVAHPSSCDAARGAAISSPSALTVGALARRYGPAVASDSALSESTRRVLRDLQRCRTAALGGHLDRCAGCGFERPSYNSCRNRHCPQCQGFARQRWLEQRLVRLLPVHHFHVVFTLPAELRGLVQRNRRALFGLLFACASETLMELGGTPGRLGPTGAQLGLSAVLHTWTRDLAFHPHLHCVVTGGGLQRDGAWAMTRPGFLFPVRVLGAVFRGKFLVGLRALARRDELDMSRADFERDVDRAAAKRWVVYCKPPFRDVQQVYAYLGRYTHRVAISNQRLVALDEPTHRVTFVTRDAKRATLPAETFLRRFLLHVLPPGFVRIRHYGLLAPTNVHTKLETARALLQPGANDEDAKPACLARAEHPDPDAPDYVRVVFRLTGVDLLACPVCHGRLIHRPLRPLSRAPP